MTRWFKKLPVTSLLLLMLFTLAGCGNSMSDLDEYIAQERAKTSPPIPPIPEIKPYLRYVYPEHDIDPFDVSILAPEIAPIAENGIKLDETRVPEFLEGYSLDSLRMVGTINKSKTLWALIRLPDGGVHSIKAGNYIGQNHGKVLLINETQIELKEIVSNGLGGYEERETSLVMEN